MRALEKPRTTVCGKGVTTNRTCSVASFRINQGLRLASGFASTSNPPSYCRGFDSSHDPTSVPIRGCRAGCDWRQYRPRKARCIGSSLLSGCPVL